MKILLTATAYPPSQGGAQAYAHQLLKQFANSGHEVHVICHWDENRTDWLLGSTIFAPRGFKQYDMDGIHVTRMALDQRTRRLIAPWLPLYYILQEIAAKRIGTILASEIKRQVPQPDIVHNVRIGRAGLSYASQLIAQDWKVPLVLTPLHHSKWSGWAYREYRSLYRTADLVIALTPTERDSLGDLGVPRTRVIVTGMAPIVSDHADAERFRSTYGLNGSIILFIGQKYRYKNLSLVLEAAKALEKSQPDVHFVFIGPRTKYSINEFRLARSENILELPIVDLQTKTDALAACDILCVPSSQESFGAVFLEAWTFEKPVIGGTAPALEDVISDGIDGYLSTGDLEDLLDRIETLLANPSQRREMGRRGKQKLMNEYSWPKLARQNEIAFEDLIAANRPSSPETSG